MLVVRLLAGLLLAAAPTLLGLGSGLGWVKTARRGTLSRPVTPVRALTWSLLGLMALCRNVLMTLPDTLSWAVNLPMWQLCRPNMRVMRWRLNMGGRVAVSVGRVAAATRGSVASG